MAGKEKLESYSPKMVHAGDFTVVTDSGTVASGEKIHELMPITLGTDGKIKAVTADTAVSYTHLKESYYDRIRKRKYLPGRMGKQINQCLICMGNG